MFTAKIYDETADGEFLGYATIDEKGPSVVDISTGEAAAIDDLETAINANLEEIVDLHDVLMKDPDAADSLGVELDTPEHREISIALTVEEDDE